ncbi:hypothetical protein Tco_1288861 [Tanacetum coccineum]
MSQSSSSTSLASYNNNSKDNVSAVRVRRWTRVQEDKEDGEEVEERPRRRKIRYAPLVIAKEAFHARKKHLVFGEASSGRCFAEVFSNIVVAVIIKYKMINDVKLDASFISVLNGSV